MPRAISYDALGPPEVLHVTDVPALEAGPGQVRVAVRTAGVNPFDWKVRSGKMRSARRAFRSRRGQSSPA